MLNTPEVLEAELRTVEKRREVAAFIDDLRERLGSDEGYVDALTQAGTQTITQENFGHLAQVLRPYVLVTRPGHDLGHVYRDMLTALAVVGNDPFIANCHPADCLAGLLGGIYHDVAVGVSPKYLDRDWECGHAEVGAWMFYRASEGIISEPLRALVSHAIAAHTQYNQDFVVKHPVLHDDGWKRPVYPDGILADGRYIRVAMWLTRFSDRLDNNGISHFARHLLAMADDVATEGAQDLSGGSFFDINPDALIRTMTPSLLDSSEGAPSVLQHMVNFRNSNYAEGSPYGVNDHLFPFFGELLAMKVSQVDRFIQVATTPSEMDTDESWKHFESLLRHISQSQFVDEPIAVLKEAWDECLTDEEKSRWGSAALYGRAAYDASLGEILSSILRIAQSDIVISALPMIIPPIEKLRS